MIKRKVRRQPVVARPPSRIRRDPVPVAVQKKAQAYPTEREVWTVVVGVILFALAISALTFGISDVMSH